MHGDISRVNYYIEDRQGLQGDHGKGKRSGWQLNQIINMEGNRAESISWRDN